MRTDAALKNRNRTVHFMTRLPAVLMFAVALLGLSPASAQAPTWVGTWTASPQPTWSADFAFPTKIPATVKNETFRQVVRISLGGSRLRFPFSNAYGDAPLRIGAASVASPGPDGAAVPGSIRKITFGGRSGIVIPPGAPAISDQRSGGHRRSRMRVDGSLH